MYPLLRRPGPDRLSGRAVTGEAGVATGLLYAHFADFDDSSHTTAAPHQ